MGRGGGGFGDEYDTWREHEEDEKQFTLRAVLVGLLVGSIVCFSNIYFGLQSKSCPHTRRWMNANRLLY